MLHPEPFRGAGRVRYRVIDGSTDRFQTAILQRNHIGWTTLGEASFTSGTVRIRLRDNEGTGPYAARFAYDACEAIPIR